MFSRALTTMLCIIVSIVISAEDAVTPLLVGDPAPPIPEVSWVRGAAVGEAAR